VLQLENGCQVAGLPEAVNLIEVKDDYRDNQNDLWLLVDSENNSIISAFYGDISFKIAGAECRLFDSVEIECESDDCSFTYQ